MRIPYVPNPPPTTSDEEAAIISRISARRAPRPLQALDLTLLHSPPVADGWNAFLGAVRTKTLLSPALRELAICRVAVCNQAWYEWAHHAPLASAAGLGPAALEVVKKGDLGSVGDEERVAAEEDGLRDKEWAVLLYADEMTRNVRVADATFERLRRACDEREIVEVTATVNIFIFFLF
jgi:alkylhydroperoxidase family enzyme